MDVEMRMPDLATTGSAISVVGWLVEVGQTVKRGQPLLEVATDKAVMEVESVVSGTLSAIIAQPGVEVEAGQVIARFEVEQAVAANRPAAGSGESEEAGPVRMPSPSITSTAPVRKGSLFARNREARASGSTASPAPRTSHPEVTQRVVALRMQESKRTIPHFYLQTSANAESMARRRTAAPGRPLAWDAFFVHAVGKALRRFERMAYRFENDRLVPQEIDAVGIAVDLDGELFTWAVDRPAEKSPEDISSEIRGAVERLRSGDPEARKMRRACMTVSNLGGVNVESFAAIINPPESAILAVGKIMPMVVPVDGQVTIQSRVTLTLSVDHRVVNGKYAGEFLGAIVEELESL